MKAVIVSKYVVARDDDGSGVLLMAKGDFVAGIYSPPAEFYLTRDQIAFLASEFPQEVTK
jgi:hypothetical protein